MSDEKKAVSVLPIIVTILFGVVLAVGTAYANGMRSDVTEIRERQFAYATTQGELTATLGQLQRDVAEIRDLLKPAQPKEPTP